MSTVRKKLAEKLKLQYYNKEFVCGVLCILKTESAMKLMLDYIETAEELEDSVTSDDLILLAMHLREEDDKIIKDKRKIVAAVL